MDLETTKIQIAEGYSKDNSIRTVYLRHWSDELLWTAGRELIMYRCYEHGYKEPDDVKVCYQPDGWFIWKATFIKKTK